MSDMFREAEAFADFQGEGRLDEPPAPREEPAVLRPWIPEYHNRVPRDVMEEWWARYAYDGYALGCPDDAEAFMLAALPTEAEVPLLVPDPDEWPETQVQA